MKLLKRLSFLDNFLDNWPIIALLFIISMIGIISFLLEHPSLWIVAILAVALGEILFWAEDVKPGTKESRFWFAAKRKISNFIQAAVFTMTGLGFINIFEKAWYLIRDDLEILLHYISYILLGIVGLLIVIGLFILLVWLNSFKYEEKKEEVQMK